MIEPIFDEVDETKIIGCEVDGNVMIFPSVPEGDAYDDISDMCCTAFEKNPRLKGKLDGWFAPNTETGQHSSWLSDEVAVWIKEGSLREHPQVNDAVKSYADHWDRLVRLGVVSKWVIDLGTIKAFRYFFNVPGSTPLPTKAEVIAEDLAWKKRQEEQYQKAAAKQREDKKILEAFEIEQARDARIKKLTQKIAAKLYSFDGLNLAADPLPPEYEQRLRKRRNFRKFSEDKVRSLVDAGKSDAEILGEMVMDVIETLKAMGRSEIRPLQKGETRRFFTESEFRQFYLSDEWDKMLAEGETSIMLAMDGLFVVTLTPMPLMTKTEFEALTAAEEKLD